MHRIHEMEFIDQEFNIAISLYSKVSDMNTLVDS